MDALATYIQRTDKNVDSSYEFVAWIPRQLFNIDSTQQIGDNCTCMMALLNHVDSTYTLATYNPRYTFHVCSTLTECTEQTWITVL